MTDLNSENRELSSDELTIDELDSVSGGRFKIPGTVLTERQIAEAEAQNPGFV